MLKKVMQEINQHVLIRLSLDAMIAGYLYFIICIFYSSQFFHNKHFFLYLRKQVLLQIYSMRSYFCKYTYDVKWSMSALCSSLTKRPLKQASPMLLPTVNLATIMLSGELQTQIPQYELGHRRTYWKWQAMLASAKITGKCFCPKRKIKIKTWL